MTNLWTIIQFGVEYLEGAKLFGILGGEVFRAVGPPRFYPPTASLVPSSTGNLPVTLIMGTYLVFTHITSMHPGSSIPARPVPMPCLVAVIEDGSLN